MKITQLMTLSQFVDLQNSIIADETWIRKPSDINSENVDSFNTATIHAFGRIKKYNDFLKQPLKKEMFVNKLEIPQECYFPDLEAFKQAEKEVIFKGWEYYDNKANNNTIDWYVKFDKYIIHHLTDNKFTLYISGTNNEWNIQTLHDLAEATNGELELKNIEL